MLENAATVHRLQQSGLFSSFRIILDLKTEAREASILGYANDSFQVKLFLNAGTAKLGEAGQRPLPVSLKLLLLQLSEG